LLILSDLLQGCSLFFFSEVRYSHDITIFLQPCVVNLVTLLLYHDCIGLVKTNKSDIMPSILLSCYQLRFQTCYNNLNKQCERNLSTACEQIWNNLFAPVPEKWWTSGLHYVLKIILFFFFSEYNLLFTTFIY
jgi:hypothetical protein